MYNWLLAMVAWMNWSTGYEIAESGESLDELKKENLLLMPNHQSTADVPFCITIISSKKGFGDNTMWILAKQFLFTNFGFVSWMHHDFFVVPGKEKRKQSLEELHDHLNRVFIPKKRKYLVLFPEGGFLHKRKPASDSFAKKNNLPLLKNVTLPRTGALEVILSVLGPSGALQEGVGPSISRVVDMTIAYPVGRPLDILAIVSGNRDPCTTHVHYRSWPVEQVPSSSSELFDWMVELYQQKEEMLSKYYETGVFPYDMFDKNALPPTVIVHNTLRWWILHVFFLVSSYFLWTQIVPFFWGSSFSSILESPHKIIHTLDIL